MIEHDPLAGQMGDLEPPSNFLPRSATMSDAWFVSRWQVEVTFAEVRAHPGVETQRQWSDKAILRTTPVLLGLFSIVTLWATDLYKSRKFKPRTIAWYPKAVLTFSDAIAAVRREIWSAPEPSAVTKRVDSHVLALDVADFAKPFAERAHTVRGGIGRPAQAFHVVLETFHLTLPAIAVIPATR
jgi:hypothetical protein